VAGPKEIGMRRKAMATAVMDDPKGRNTVRELARQVADLASSDENQRRIRR
jgi:hypothetical protein